MTQPSKRSLELHTNWDFLNTSVKQCHALIAKTSLHVTLVQGMGVKSLCLDKNSDQKWEISQYFKKNSLNANETEHCGEKKHTHNSSQCGDWIY